VETNDALCPVSKLIEYISFSFAVPFDSSQRKPEYVGGLSARTYLAAPGDYN